MPASTWRAAASALLLLVASALLVACGGAGQYIWVSQLPEDELLSSAHIEAGDRLYVHVHNQPELSAEVEVSNQGAIVVPIVGALQVRGKTPDALAAELKQRLTGTLVNPTVQVSVLARRAIAVDVIGEVVRPGRYEVPRGEGLIGALAAAGGLTEFASEDQLYVLRREPAARRIRFDYRQLLNGAPRSHAFVLRSGDVVVVE